MKVKIILLCFSILFAIGNANAQDIKVSAKLTDNSIVIGDQTSIVLRLECPASRSIRWPVINDSLSSELEICKYSKIDTLLSEDKKSHVLSQNLTITSFDSGAYHVPAFEFRYRDKNDTADNILITDSLLLHVYTVAVDTTKAFKKIKDPLDAPFTLKEALPWIIGGLALVGIIVLLIYIIRRYRKKKPLIQLPKKPVLKPHEKALQELEKLRIRKLWQEGRVKEYHTLLTDIIRIYLFDQFRVDAIEMVTYEIMSAVENVNISNEAKSKLKELLELADLVKFAKAEPLPDEHDKCYKNAEAFVKFTLPVDDKVVDNKPNDNITDV